MLARPGGKANLQSSLLTGDTADIRADLDTNFAALWSLTNSLRLEPAPSKIRLAGLHVGFVDTGMVQHIDRPKVTPESVVDTALAGLAADEYEIVVDETSKNIKRGLTQDVRVLYPALP